MPTKNHKTDKLYVNRDEVAGNLRGTTRIEPVPRVPLERAILVLSSTRYVR